MDPPVDLATLSNDQLPTLAMELDAQLADRQREVGEKERKLQYRQTRIAQLTHEFSVIKRLQFSKRSDQLNTEQMSLLDEAVDTDLAELERLQPDTPERRSRQQRPRRAPLHRPSTGFAAACPARCICILLGFEDH
jgi:transposase